jgi:hypothetical protein
MTVLLYIVSLLLAALMGFASTPPAYAWLGPLPKF